HALSDHRQRCLEAGMDDFISKPYGERELAAVVDHWLGLDQAALESLPLPRPQEGTTPFDHSAIDSLRRLGESTGQHLIRELVVSFSRRSREGARTLREAGEAGDAATLERLAHSLRGIAAQLGAAALAATLEDIETLAEAGELAKCRTLLDRFDEELPRAISWLEGEAGLDKSIEMSLVDSAGSQLQP
ncbi:MAG: Hpt domain-containing protein, partial [Acidobacteria bacterium]|nr:Hpt domain-containing protein [Acidobacteriota bacterium]